MNGAQQLYIEAVRLACTLDSLVRVTRRVGDPALTRPHPAPWHPPVKKIFTGGPGWPWEEVQTPRRLPVFRARLEARPRLTAALGPSNDWRSIWVPPRRRCAILGCGSSLGDGAFSRFGRWPYRHYFAAHPLGSVPFCRPGGPVHTRRISCSLNAS